MLLFAQKHKLFVILAHMSSKKIYEMIGWIGVVIILASYSLLSLGIIDGQSYIFHALILVGSLCILVISLIKKTYQPVVLNGVFAFLSVIALVRLAFL
jgi:hypothetical protein